MAILELYTKRRIGQVFHDLALHLDNVVFGHFLVTAPVDFRP